MNAFFLTDIRTRMNFLLAAVVFAVVLAAGFYLAGITPLENDEIHSQIYSVESYTYGQILAGEIEGEGNNTPLFYLTQKVATDLSGYTSPPSWMEGERVSTDEHSMIFLRIQPLLLIALSAAWIVYEMARLYSPGAAMFSLFMFFSSGYVWLHWPEGRPYALWIFLSVWQLFLFVRMMLSQAITVRQMRWLAVVHILLALTFIISLGQIVAVCALLWLLKDRRWRPYMFWMVVPVGICVYYYLQLPHYQTYLPVNAMDLIWSCLPPEHLVLAGIFLVTAMVRQKIVGREPDHLPRIGFILAGLLMLLFAAALALLGVFIIKCGGATEGHKISARYWLFLTPAGVIISAIMLIQLWRWSAAWIWARINFIIVAAGFIIILYARNTILWEYVNIILR